MYMYVVCSEKVRNLPFPALTDYWDFQLKNGQNHSQLANLQKRSCSQIAHPMMVLYRV